MPANTPSESTESQEARAHFRFTNHLVNETSPYLLQHAHNPVNWYPWGDEAFAKAKAENKPVFLSVGYSTCYWCHVMERESFENEEVAKVLNEHFIAIKVDREERPDVDEQYMLATQLVTGRGGWPNSLWLLPDGRPFMAGTYFPRQQFIQVLQAISNHWTTRRPDVDEQANRLADAIRQAGGFQGGDGTAPTLGRAYIDRAVDALRQSFDSQHGGFGTAPKFPPHDSLRLLTAAYHRSKDAELLHIIDRTLDGMWRGGVHDHVGGGFHRYSTDERWFLPHFEKMLYDNGQLMRAYTDGFLLTGDPRYRQAVDEIHAWVQREMTDPLGGFYSALDSESDGEEGQFYVWKRDELMSLLGTDEAPLFSDLYGFEADGNWFDEATRQRPGTNIPFLPRPVGEFADDRKMVVSTLLDTIARDRSLLLDARDKRPYPHRDDKILTGWNALMIDALAYAGSELEEPKYVESAERAAQFLLDRMMQSDGRLLRTYRAGQARLPAYLTDYAYLVRALVTLYQADGRRVWLDAAERLAHAMLEDFEDRENGGFFFTSERHDTLMVRSKNLTGGGNIPSGNAVAAEALLDLARQTDSQRCRKAARRTLEALAGLMWNSPQASTGLLVATNQWLNLRDGDIKPAVAATTDSADVVAKRRPVTVTLSAPKRTLAPGDTVVVNVALAIDDGWHLYGPSSDPVSPVTPTTVRLLSNPLATASKATVPEGRTKDDPVLNKAIDVYEGSVVFSLPVTIDRSAATGPCTLTVQLRWQACDRARCLSPDTVDIELPMSIIARR